MSDSHNDDPFAPPRPEPPPEPFPEPFSARVERFGEIPVEAYVPPALPPVEAYDPPALPAAEAYGPPAMALAPAEGLTGAEPAAAAVAADPRIGLDGTSLWLNRLGEELVAWLKTLASAAVYATLIVTFGFQVARV